MKAINGLLLGIAGSALISTSASAADLAPMMPAPTPEMAAAPGFSWEGPYVGAFGGFDFGFGLGEAGVQYGYNFVWGNFLAGIEVETGHTFIPAALINASLNHRAGFILGDRVLLYGEVGIGSKLFAPIWNAGGGIEVAVGDSISLFVEGKAEFVIGGGYLGPQISAGVNYHPGGGAMSASAGGFSWEGLYFGALGGYTTGFGFVDVEVQAGYNIAMGGSFLAGVEVETTHPVSPGAIISASLNGRLGGTFGNFLVYGEAGIGGYIAAPVWTAGGGVEVGLGGNVSLFGEAKAMMVIGGGYIATQIRGGLNYHFGR